MMKSTKPLTVNQVPLLDVCRDNDLILNEIAQAISAVLLTGRFIGGPDCQELERSIARQCGANHAVGCASGSDALLLTMLALGIGEGDEVLVPSFTFFATVSAVTRVGAIPVFVDIDPTTYNLDPKLIEAAITSRTKAIIPVHLFGQCADMTSIMKIARQHNLFVVEDVAQSIGASHAGQLAGSIGDAGCLSFYPTKNLGGLGDGGMITANDQLLADRIRLYANHGMSPRYHHQVVGINSRLDTIQAAGLNIKLKHLQQWTTQRQENAQRYRRLFAQFGLSDWIGLPSEDQLGNHVWNQYTIRIRHGNRDEFRSELSKRQIGAEVYYPIPMHQQACFRYLGYKNGALPQTELAASQVLSLPIFPSLTEQEQEYVVRSISEIVETTSLSRRQAS